MDTNTTNSAELEFPIAPIKRIMKLNDEVNQIQPVSALLLLNLFFIFCQESVIAVSKSAELFLAALAEDSYQICNYNGRKTIKVIPVLLWL